MEPLNLATIPRAERVVRRAACPAGLSVGDLVYVSGPMVGTAYQVALATPVATSLPAAGVVIKKLTATECFVLFSGPLRGVYTGLLPGQAYYVGTNSRPVDISSPNMPLPATASVFQQVGLALSADEVLFGFLATSTGWIAGASRLYDVALSGVQDGANRVFTAPFKFIVTGPRAVVLYWNGVRQIRGGDYFVSESVLGDGFDTFTTEFTPRVDHTLRSDFDIDL